MPRAPTQMWEIKGKQKGGAEGAETFPFRRAPQRYELLRRDRPSDTEMAMVLEYLG